MSAPTICLNTIVRDEAHVVGEVLDAVTPYIAHWVVVDTGSTDGTQDVIRAHMAARGVPGELHERPWRDFGHNRSEALALAQGHGEYIWVIDADDTVVGTPRFTDRTADVYLLRIGDGSLTYWRRQLFRDYLGVVHEYPECDVPYVEARIDGDYYVDSRRLGARSRDPRKYARDAELLLAEVERNPDDESGRCSISRRATPTPKTPPLPAPGTGDGPRCPAGTRRPRSRNSVPRRRCRSSASRGRTCRTRTCGRGSSVRRGPNRCTRSRATTAWPRGIRNDVARLRDGVSGTASLDEVLCVGPTWSRNDESPA